MVFCLVLFVFVSSLFSLLLVLVLLLSISRWPMDSRATGKPRTIAARIGMVQLSRNSLVPPANVQRLVHRLVDISGRVGPKVLRFGIEHLN